MTFSGKESQHLKSMFKRLINRFLLQEQAFYQNFVGSYFDRNINNDIKFFEKYHPKNDYERSLAQHRCQVYPFKKEVLSLNFKAFFLTPVIIVALLMKKRVLVKDDFSTIVCYNCYNLPVSLPDALRNERIKSFKSAECPYYLTKKDLPFLLRFIFKSFWHPFLVLRVLLKVAKYRAIIDSFKQLETIAITGEFIDTSSVMTQYCHENNIKHFNFMQGDMLGSPRIAFFHFDKCYIWDQHYEDMFMSFGAYPGQFEVYTPQCLQKIDSSIIDKKIDYTYYVGGYPNEDLLTIRAALDKLVASGNICEVRPHPHWSDIEEIHRVFDGISVQDVRAIGINDSILMTKNVIGLCSTVLLQSYYNDVNVVIDNLTCPDKFKMLEKYQYIMLNKPHELLSEITNS